MDNLFEKIKNTFKKQEIKTQNEDVPSIINRMYASLDFAEISVCVGTDLDALVENLAEKIGNLRQLMFDKNGFILPVIPMTVNEEYQENEYRIFVRGNEVFTGFVIPNQDFAPDEICQKIEDVCEEHLSEIFSTVVVEKYIDLVNSATNRLVRSLFDITDITGVRIILLDLLKDGKSIKNITSICEKICEFGAKNRAQYSKFTPKIIGDFVKQNMATLSDD